MPQRTVAMLITASKKVRSWQCTKRRCKQCRAWFLPVRDKQEFCPGGVCRVAWWSEHQATEVHRCRCGRACAGADPSRCRRSWCNGTLIPDEGGTVCILCNRPGEALEQLLAEVEPRRRVNGKLVPDESRLTE